MLIPKVLDGVKTHCKYVVDVALGFVDVDYFIEILPVALYLDPQVTVFERLELERSEIWGFVN